jgi:hypothetical protein
MILQVREQMQNDDGRRGAGAQRGGFCVILIPIA